MFGVYCDLPNGHDGLHNDGFVEWRFVDDPSAVSPDPTATAAPRKQPHSPSEAAAMARATAAPPLPCPVHAACAHPCRFVRALNGYPRSMVDAAIEGVADTYTTEGVGIWWRAWIKQGSIERDRRLQWATTYGGMVAT